MASKIAHGETLEIHTLEAAKPSLSKLSRKSAGFIWTPFEKFIFKLYKKGP